MLCNKKYIISNEEKEKTNTQYILLPKKTNNDKDCKEKTLKTLNKFSPEEFNFLLENLRTTKEQNNIDSEIPRQINLESNEYNNNRKIKNYI